MSPLSLKNAALFSVFVFSAFSVFLFVHHELRALNHIKITTNQGATASKLLRVRQTVGTQLHRAATYLHLESPEEIDVIEEIPKETPPPIEEEEEGEGEESKMFSKTTTATVKNLIVIENKLKKNWQKETKAVEEDVSKQAAAAVAVAVKTKDSTTITNIKNEIKSVNPPSPIEKTKVIPPPTTSVSPPSLSTSSPKSIETIVKSSPTTTTITSTTATTAAATMSAEVSSTPPTTTSSLPDPSTLKEERGVLYCNGTKVDSEVIFWKIVPGDISYESPITPHHGLHHDRYLSFEYDQGGWNNVRMGMECLIVAAHAMGRTLVVPPQQHLYLLGRTHRDQGDAQAHDEMGFEDFFDIDLLRSHQGFHVLHMEEFLEKEGVTGGLHGKLPPHNSSEAWGSALWSYLDKVADEAPEWMGRFLAMPTKDGDFMFTGKHSDEVAERLKRFGGERTPVFYDKKLQDAHHIHFPADSSHRLLQHHYAFTFFADKNMQSFYKRFVRDFMRYKDEIQCAGANLVAAIREDSRRVNVILFI